MNRGFVIIAQNTANTDYIKCAELLCKNIKRLMPDEQVALLTGKKFKSKYFDYVIEFPYGDLAPDSDWKLINDWQVYEASPFEYSIKIEADMYLPRKIDHWWDILKDRDVVVSSAIRNYKQEISNVRTYRRFIDDNKLPDVYNSLTYFKKGDLAKNFFLVTKNIFDNWEDYKATMICNPKEKASTDWVYALACHILGVGQTTMPQFTDMSMVHMKQYINDLPTEDWTDVLIYEALPHSLRIHTHPQMYPFHYYIKDFCDILAEVEK